MKFCKKCNSTKPFSEFYKRSASNDGLAPMCKACSLAYDRKHRPRKLKPIVKTKTHRACRKCDRMIPIGNTYCDDCKYIYQSSRQITRYGITPDQYLEMLKAQNFVCAICKRPERKGRRLSIDHDHSCCDLKGNHRACGQCVRGLLCSHCNRAMGMVDDNPAYLQAMIDYLHQQL